MTKYILILSAFMMVFASCSGPSAQMVKQAKMDDSIIVAYLKANPQIKAVKDPSGLYYQITDQGTGAYPAENSVVMVNYTCNLIGGRRYDSGSDFSAPLSGLIKAWQIGMPHLKAGGSMLLFVPSGLAYGPSGAGPIPGDAVLAFDINLISFK
jgi:FKBP-type peptidyl-prolyl cis-trans isomerase FkpA